MSPETIALTLTVITTLAAAFKAWAEAKKAKAEAEKARVEAELREQAEKERDVIIHGVEKAKKTLLASDMAKYLQDEIQGTAVEHGVEESLNKAVKRVRNSTGPLDRNKLLRKLDGTGDGNM